MSNIRPGYIAGLPAEEYYATLPVYDLTSEWAVHKLTNGDGVIPADFILIADDYHEFRSIERVFLCLGINMNFVELYGDEMFEGHRAHFYHRSMMKPLGVPDYIPPIAVDN